MAGGEPHGHVRVDGRGVVEHVGSADADARVGDARPEPGAGAPDEFVESDRLWGVWRFKDGFQGEVVRHIGAWDFAVRPFLYKLFMQVIPKYLKMLRGRK
jgi:hypothetical protein